jgi:putative flippase GtrA
MSEFDLPPVNAPPGLLLRLIRDQRVAFLIVGGINTVVGFGFFVLADLVLGPIIDAVAGEVVGSLVVLAVAHVLGVLFAFVMHRRFVFRVTGHVLRDLARFESVYLVSLGINAIVLPVLVAIGIPRLIAQAAITLVTTVLSYVGHRYFSFRRPAGPADSAASAESTAGPSEDQPRT